MIPSKWAKKLDETDHLEYAFNHNSLKIGRSGLCANSISEEKRPRRRVEGEKIFGKIQACCAFQRVMTWGFNTMMSAMSCLCVFVSSGSPDLVSVEFPRSKVLSCIAPK